MAVPTPVPIAMATATDADSRRDTAGRYWSGLMDRCASPCNFRSSHCDNVCVGGAVPEIAWFDANSDEGGRESGKRQLHIVRDDEVGLAGARPHAASALLRPSSSSHGSELRVCSGQAFLNCFFDIFFLVS